MDETPNIFADRFTFVRWSRWGEPVARKAGGRELGGTLWELGPGADHIPLHIHHALEEPLIVIAGTPTLRTLEGERELRAGDVVAFPRGRRGAHTVVNRSEKRVRYLMLSTKMMPEVVEYPEQGTLRVLTRAPFDPPNPATARLTGSCCCLTAPRPRRRTRGGNPRRTRGRRPALR